MTKIKRLSPHSRVLLIAIVCATPGSMWGQDMATRRAAAVAYLTTHADREEMVMVPMRDGVRLSALILFPKDRPRQNLPTILVYKETTATTPSTGSASNPGPTAKSAPSAVHPAGKSNTRSTPCDTRRSRRRSP
jgi:hypothetical protein